MKKRSILLTILSVIFVVSFAMPLFLASAEEPASVPKTVIVNIFDGSNANELDFTNQKGEVTATVVDDNGVTAISISNAWSGLIQLQDTIDLTKAKDGQLCFEYRLTGEKSWAKVGVVTYANYWKEPVVLNGNGNGDSVGVAAEYTVKRYDLSPLTDAQLAKFKGFSLGTGETFLIKRVWIEYPNPDYTEDTKPTTEGTYELITEAVASVQNMTTWGYEAVIPSEYNIQKGDKIKIKLNVDIDVPESGKAIDMWVGDVAINFNGDTKENYIYSKTAEWEYTFNGSYVGDVKLRMWGTGYTVEKATLTIVKHEQEAPVTSCDIFTGITEVGEPALNDKQTAWTATYKGTVDGKVMTDGSALAFGTLEDGTYYVSGTNAKTAVRATIAMTDITPALLGGGVLKFKAKLDFAGEEGRYAKIRLYYESGQWGEASFVETDLTGYVAGEWKEYSVALTTLNVACAPLSTWGNPAAKVFDWTKFIGMGIAMGSAGEGDNVASFADVKIVDFTQKAIVGIEAEGAKTEYNSGEAFETEGLVVKVVFDDQSKVEVKNYKYDPATLVVGTENVVVSWSYKGKTYTTDIAVNVISEYSALVVKTQPTKTNYKAGEKFEKDGMVVAAVKSDGTEVEITDYEYYKGMITPDMTSIELSYNGTTTKVNVTVAQFENTLSLTNKAFAKDGEPSYGWQAVVGKKSLTSQAKYDKLSDDDKANVMVTPKDDEKGYYITASFDVNNYATRIFEFQVADYKLGNIYEDESYNAMVSITYRTNSTFDKAVNFGLANFKEWNLGYHNADVSGYIVADGEWHTMYFDIALNYGEIDGMLWTSDMSGIVNFNQIVGFAIQSKAEGTLDIVDVSVNWNGDKDAAKVVDTTAPEFEYSGEMTITAKAGDDAPRFENEKAYDKYDGEVQVIVEWSENAVTDGKLNEGEHTVKLYAQDAAGNRTEAYVITVNVEKGEVTPPAPKPDSKGCMGTLEKATSIICLVALAGAFVIVKRKRND